MYHLKEVVLILLDPWYLFGLKEEVIGHHLIDRAAQRKYISVGEVIMANEHLRGTILPCLNILSEVLMGKAGITEISNFKEQLVIQLNLHALPVQNRHVDPILNISVLILCKLHLLRLCLHAALLQSLNFELA